MSSFAITIFLLTGVSSSRIVHALLQKGYSIEPGFEGGKMCIEGAGNPSTPFRIIIKSRTNTGKLDLRSLLVDELQVPFFGFVITDARGDEKTATGYLPKIKNTTCDAGPYRKTGNVVSLVPKDDGIIDDMKK